jgi:hypothetical protein
MLPIVEDHHGPFSSPQWLHRRIEDAPVVETLPLNAV